MSRQDKKVSEKWISYWPLGERPRERLLKHGAGSLSEASLLSIFLRVGVKGMSAVDLARKLLSEFGGLRGLFQAGEADLRKIKGLGTAKIATLVAVAELNKRYLEEKVERGKFIECARDVHDLLAHRFSGLDQEIFTVIYLDTKHRILGKPEELFHGTIDASSVYPREVVKRALAVRASALIAVHNHPSGEPEPSAADKVLTRDLKAACRLMEISLLDHIIVGARRYFSFAEANLL
ncbi:MAG: DNA repair protein RadC [Acidobacteria bacterium]|nr:DNA repair protein RadC [Acidobacteriota bacterium]